MLVSVLLAKSIDQRIRLLCQLVRDSAAAVCLIVGHRYLIH